MFYFKFLLLTAHLVVQHVVAIPAQVPLQLQATKEPKKLRGRFLHITDLHPDPHYLPNTAESTACHRKKKKKKEKNVAGYYGTPYSDCDSPLRLTNFTLDFLKENWADEIDFVIWTGDSARHDNDDTIPQTPSEVYELNEAMADKMYKSFHREGIPVVPSLGNNDVSPHNIMELGPNCITCKFASIWSHFIPFPYLQVFQRGAYYASEVIPGEVAVISLNTMYFYNSNTAVSGCRYKKPKDPGNLQFDWLDAQLEKFQKKGMQVWISGHVPPTPKNYYSECYVRYVELALRYQDTILGHLFGHMNADHFFFLEAEDRIESEVTVSAGKKLLKSLLEDFATLPRKPKPSDIDRYAVVNVAPSVIPKYLPSFRIYSYNTTGEEELSLTGEKKTKVMGRHHEHRRASDGNKVNCKLKEFANTWRCHLRRRWHSDPDSPSRRNQQWTPLGYSQYYIPSLDSAKKSQLPEFELEYVTYTTVALHPEGGQYPVPPRFLPMELRDPTSTQQSRYTPYKLEDLTIGSWMELGSKIGDESQTKLRKRFCRNMFMELPCWYSKASLCQNI